MKIRKILSLFLMLCLLAGCGAQPTAQETTHADDAVVIALDVNSEPAAGFDPAYGWGAGEHVHEPLIQSTLTVTNPDLTIGYDLATGYTVSVETGVPTSTAPTYPVHAVQTLNIKLQ